MLRLLPILKKLEAGYMIQWVQENPQPTFADAWRKYPYLSGRMLLVNLVFKRQELVRANMNLLARTETAGDVSRYLQQPSVVRTIEEALVAYAKWNGCAVEAPDA